MGLEKDLRLGWEPKFAAHCLPKEKGVGLACGPVYMGD